MTNHTDLIFTEEKGNGGSLGIITLNRPQALNSLNHAMIASLSKQLKAWSNNDEIKGVFIQAVPGRAFCAGGDIRLTYNRMKEHDQRMTEFFREEYHLNQLIFHYPKPYIALLDGITMGGGVGISIHGSHRIGTENLLFAMPETGIGFFPDVGGTYFLPRLKNKMGIYLGLTGARITTHDCMALGIINHTINRKQADQLIQTLIDQSFEKTPKETVSHILNNFQVTTTTTALIEQQEAIRDCFSHDSIESILAHLAQSSSAICQEAWHILQKKSPTSLKISLHAMLLGEKMDFNQCMQQEYRLVHQFLQSHDFPEGIRAAIIDKDQNPKWQPSKLSEVSEKIIDSYFQPITEELN